MEAYTSKLRMGVYFDQPVYSGGGHQQSLNVISLVKKLPSDLVETYYFTNLRSNIVALDDFGVDVKYINLGLFNRLKLKVRCSLNQPKIARLFSIIFGANSFEKEFQNKNIDVVYFISPTNAAEFLDSINYIFTVWDLSHRDDLEFPEVRAGRVFDERENLFRKILPKSMAIIADSAIGKKNILTRYGVDDCRVKIMPFSPAPNITKRENYNKINYDVTEKYRICNQYVFYPAQFWPHKNHVYILFAIKYLAEIYHHRVSAVFSGVDKGNYAYVQSVVKKLKLEEQIHFVGFVGNEEISALYENSIALIMPTYFGPTNMPPLEAFTLGIPVLYSDKDGLKDQVKDAALLMDLSNPLSAAKLIASLIEDTGLRDSLVKKGFELIGSFDDSERISTLVQILKEFQYKKVSWGS